MTDSRYVGPLATVLNIHRHVPNEHPDVDLAALCDDDDCLWWDITRALSERILADPGPLLEALATAGVLREEWQDRCATCGEPWGQCENIDEACSMAGLERLRDWDAERRYVTGWRADD